MRYTLEIGTVELTWQEKKQLAKKLGVTTATVYRILNGEFKVSDKFLKALWGKEKYTMWITRLREVVNSDRLKK